MLLDLLIIWSFHLLFWSSSCIQLSPSPSHKTVDHTMILGILCTGKKESVNLLQLFLITFVLGVYLVTFLFTSLHVVTGQVIHFCLVEYPEVSSAQLSSSSTTHWGTSSSTTCPSWVVEQVAWYSVLHSMGPCILRQLRRHSTIVLANLSWAVLDQRLCADVHFHFLHLGGEGDPAFF